MKYLSLLLALLCFANQAIADDGDDVLNEVSPTAVKIEVATPKKTNFVVRIKERIYNQAKGEYTSWPNLPLSIVSYPITKAEYGVFQPVAATVTESVTRSPIHNALGTFDEAKKTARLYKNGVVSLGRGILNPRNAAFFDGILELADGTINVATGVAAGVVKSAVSIVGYPIFRLFGGAKSRRDAISGKRAAIIFVDTGFSNVAVIHNDDGTVYTLDPRITNAVDYVGDTYAAEMIRYQMKGVVDYFCIVSDSSGSDLDDCLAKMPEKIKNLDFVAMTHTGGEDRMESGVRAALEARPKLKIGLMLSIGCDDGVSDLTNPDNAMGQQGTSWAVHYYLMSAVAKRLRGEPIQSAAKEAFYEDLPINFANPVSLVAMGAVHVLDHKGLDGSFPETKDPAPPADAAATAAASN